MRVPMNPRTGGRRAPLGLAMILVLATAACGGATASTPPSSAATPAAAPASPTAVLQTTAASAAAAASPTATSEQPSQAPLAVLWDKGGPAGSNTSTVSSAIDPLTGNLWVAVPFENRFWILSPQGKYLESWGTPGSGPGQFDLSDHAQHPDGWGAIAFAPDGSFFIGDTGRDRVEEFDAKRTFVRQWGSFGSGDGQFTQITSIATDGKTVYVGDGQRYDIQAFKADGTFLRAFGADAGWSVVAVDARGRVHATNPQNPAGAAFGMAIFGPDGTPTTQSDLTVFGGWPVSVSVDAAGDSFVSVELGESPFTPLALVEIDPMGRVVRSWPGVGNDVATVTQQADAVYTTRGVQLDGTQWTSVRKYALPAP